MNTFAKMIAFGLTLIGTLVVFEIIRDIALIYIYPISPFLYYGIGVAIG